MRQLCMPFEHLPAQRSPRHFRVVAPIAQSVERWSYEPQVEVHIQVVHLVLVFLSTSCRRARIPLIMPAPNVSEHFSRVYKSPGFTLPSLVSGKMTSPRSSRTSKNFTVAFIFELTSSRCSNACSLRSAVKHNGFGSACGANSENLQQQRSRLCLGLARGTRLLPLLRCPPRCWR